MFKHFIERLISRKKFLKMEDASISIDGIGSWTEHNSIQKTLSINGVNQLKTKIIPELCKMIKASDKYKNLIEILQNTEKDANHLKDLAKDLMNLSFIERRLPAQRSSWGMNFVFWI